MTCHKVPVINIDHIKLSQILDNLTKTDMRYYYTFILLNFLGLDN